MFNCYYEDRPAPEEQIKNLNESIKKVTQIAQNTIATIKKILDAALVLTQKLKTYPNQHVVYLAFHGKPRVRKKNIKRITKWLEREEKWKTK